MVNVKYIKTKHNYLNEAIKSGSLQLTSITTDSYYVAVLELNYQRNLNSVATVYSMFTNKN
jgi:hypothetical protein